MPMTCSVTGPRRGDREHVAHSEVLQAGDGGPEDDETGASLVFGAAGAVER